MPSIIFALVLVVLIFFYVGRVIYKSVKRIKESESCCGGCDNCAKSKYKK